jgi:predicted methyltransferase
LRGLPPTRRTGRRILTFRNLHDWIGDKADQVILGAIFKVLKPGGVLGPSDHRARADADPTQSGKTGYVPEAFRSSQEHELSAGEATRRPAYGLATLTTALPKLSTQ